ncbi:hypothetical protein F4804DRAFT_92442 [Jackrogersella minutella]|nr:hypothetical protein F4804DRAFT_92442 [Jackrogersella minutella]
MALPFPVPHLPPWLSISCCTVADVDEIAEVYYEGFQTDLRNTFWWSEDKDAMFAWMKRRIRRKMADPSVRHFKVTNVDGGDIVAWARWDIPGGLAAALGGAMQGENLPVGSAPVETSTPAIDYPEGVRPELCQVFFSALREMAEKHNTKTMLGLSLLCTSPKYHRRGAAWALTEPMWTLADAHGVKAYLEATPGGKPVYEKWGFREVDELTFDLEKLTDKFKETYKLSIMVREPKSIP